MSEISEELKNKLDSVEHKLDLIIQWINQYVDSEIHGHFEFNRIHLKKYDLSHIDTKS